MIKIFFNKIIIKTPDIKKCVCGKCDNLILIVEFNNGINSYEWCAKLSELKVITDNLNNVINHNVLFDNYCYKAKEGEDGENS